MNFDFEQERRHEQARILILLGDTLNHDYDYYKILTRARDVGIRFDIFLGWWRTVKATGPSGLIQKLADLDEKSLESALKWRSELGDNLDKEFVPVEDIQEIAERNGWGFRKADRWVARYRVGGLWALAPHNDPFKTKQEGKGRAQGLGGFSEKETIKIAERKRYIDPLLNLDTIREIDVINRAKELQAQGVPITDRTLWTYLAEYLTMGMGGMGRKQRSDAGSSRWITPQMTVDIRNLRLSGKYKNVEQVHIRACTLARERGEIEPTEYQVKKICRNIPKVMRAKADGRIKVISGSQKPTAPIYEEGMVIQIDSTLIDLMVLDKRHILKESKGKNQQKRHKKQQPKQVRLWLILCLDGKTRKVVGRKVMYDHPDRFAIGAVLRQLILDIGKPDEILMDQGKDYKSEHIQVAAEEIDLNITYLPAHNPQLKGKIERFFGTLNTRLWSTLPGYTGSNPKDRPAIVKAELTPDEMVAKLDAFIEQYNNEVHSQTERTPNEFWQEHKPRPTVEPSKLAVFLKASKSNKVYNKGILYNSEYYWHRDLFRRVRIGNRALIRAEPYEKHPAEVEVFYKGEWICTAFNLKSARGRALTREEINEVQSELRHTIDEEITKAKEATEKYDKPAEAPPKKDDPNEKQTNAADVEKPVSTAQKAPKKSQEAAQVEQDPWDRV